MRFTQKVTHELSLTQFKIFKQNFFGKNYCTGLYIDCRLQQLEVSGQEILTQDKVSIRINLTASYRLTDVELCVNSLKDYQDFLYRELQLALREAVGTELLDNLLEDKEQIRKVVMEVVSQKARAHGMDLENVGVKDIILPGEMRTIFNQVVEAEKAAQANLIRRREETQATRSLNNTAKMMENSPILLRLKELESLEKISERIEKLTVVNGLEGILSDLVSLGPAQQLVSAEKQTTAKKSSAKKTSSKSSSK